MKPEEYDVVRLRTSLPAQGLSVGAEGTVVMDYSTHSGGTQASEYEVEFVSADGDSVLATVAQDDLDVVWRASGQGGQDSQPRIAD